MATRAMPEDRDTACLFPRALAIALKVQNSKKVDYLYESSDASSASGGSSGPKPPPPDTGKGLFDKFLEVNSECYWNPHLDESLRNLQYIGYLHPNTILVGGRDIYLDTVRSAWCRRVLRSPPNYGIVKVGDLSRLDMSVMPQTQFTPLPEALCLIVSDLNRSKTAATLEFIQELMKERYTGMQMPPEQMIYEVLEILINERKLLHTPTGYYIMTPELLKSGCTAEHGSTEQQKLSTVYIPVVSPPVAEACSISCQTEAAVDENSVESKASAKEERRRSRLERSHSMKAKRRDKQQKEEAFARSSSLRYGEEKAIEVVNEISLRTSETMPEKEKGEKKSVFKKIFGRHRKEPNLYNHYNEEEKQEEPAVVEYATFSAQFPPPELQSFEVHIQSFLEQHPEHNDANSTLSKSHTWQHGQVPPWMKCEANGPQKSLTIPPNAVVLPWQRRTRSSSSHSDSQSSTQEKQAHQRDCSQTRPKANQRSSMDTSVKQKLSHTLDSYDSHAESNIYCEPESVAMMASGGTRGCTLPHSSADGYILENGAPNVAPHRMNLRSPRTHYSNLYGNDISIEYHGAMPKKGSYMSMSRDSGVNFIGQNGSPSKANVQNRRKVSPQSGSSKQRASQCEAPQASSQIKHQALVHHFPDAFTAHQDSGFSSPRTDTENVYAQNNNDDNYESPINMRHKSYYNDKQLFNKKSNKVDDNGNKIKLQDKFTSKESIYITGSDFYPVVPNVNAGLLRQGQITPSSSMSSSSRQTVLDRDQMQSTPDTGRKVRHSWASKGRDSPSQHADTEPRSLGQLAQNSPRPRPSAHRRRRENRDRSLTKEGRISRKDDSRGQSSNSISHHQALNNGYGSHHQRESKENNPRLAFLGDCHVVGVV